MRGPVRAGVTLAAFCLAFVPGALLSGGCGPPSTRGADGKAEGAKVYAVYCEGCHGRDGRKGEAGTRLVDAAAKPPDAMRAVIRNGRGLMPAWKDRIAEDEITAVLEYMRQFRADRSSP